MRCLALMLLVSLPALALGRSKAVAVAGAEVPAWAAAQAVGPPNVEKAGDDARAWATLYADAGEEWLELTYDTPVTVAQLRIFETFNPGAVSKVVGLSDGREVTLWSGTATSTGGKNVLLIKAGESVTTNRIRIYLETSRVAGWNEIDAVELVGLDGSKQWATGATASSSYAVQGGGGGTLQSAIGQRVRVQVGGTAFTGKLLRREGEFLVFEAEGKTRLVAIAAIEILEF